MSTELKRLQINVACQQTAELLLMRLKDPEVDTKTAVEGAIQQLRLLVEPIGFEPVTPTPKLKIAN